MTHTLTDIITTFFKSPFSDQSTTVQTRQSVFVQLLGAVFRVAQAAWLTSDQRLGVESCIKTLADVAKSRGIAIPSELDIQVRRGSSNPQSGCPILSGLSFVICWPKIVQNETELGISK